MSPPTNDGNGTRHHTLPRDEFAALARGGGGVAAIRRLVAAQHSKHVLLVAGVRELARRADDRIGLAGYELLEQVRRQDKNVADEVISYPSVGVWALHTIRGDQEVPGAQTSGLAAVAASAAIKAGLDAEIEVPVVSGSVFLPALGAADAAGVTATVQSGIAEIRSGQRSVTARAGAPGWRDLRRARAGSLDVLIDDVDPFRMPASDGEPASRLSPARLTEFVELLKDGWDVLDPASAAEIAAMIRVIVPYQAPEDGRVSTSSPQAFGTVAMSLQPDKYSCAEVLIHEAQHLKLSGVLDLVPLTREDDGQTYYAPWRADPRPASGLLQGAYAFLGVSGFWREQRAAAPELTVRQRAQAEFARWRDGAAQVAGTLLGSGQLTEAGQDFVGEFAQVLAAWQQEPVPPEALAQAQGEADKHLAQWQADNA